MILILIPLTIGMVAGSALSLWLGPLGVTVTSFVLLVLVTVAAVRSRRKKSPQKRPTS